jgi:hypothetical protein
MFHISGAEGGALPGAVQRSECSLLPAVRGEGSQRGDSHCPGRDWLDTGFPEMRPPHPLPTRHGTLINKYLYTKYGL